MNPNNAPKRGVVYVRTGTIGTTSANMRGFRELLEAIARGEFQVVDVEVKRLQREGANGKNRG